MKQKKTGDYAADAVVNAIMIAFINTVLLWRHATHGVVLESWVDILWAANLSLGAQVVGGILLACWRPVWLQAATRALLAAAGLLSIIVFFLVFPLDFSPVQAAWVNTLLKVLLVAGMGGTLIGLGVDLARLARANASAA